MTILYKVWGDIMLDKTSNNIYGVQSSRLRPLCFLATQRHLKPIRTMVSRNLH